MPGGSRPANFFDMRLRSALGPPVVIAGARRIHFPDQGEILRRRSGADAGMARWHDAQRQSDLLVDRWPSVLGH